MVRLAVSRESRKTAKRASVTLVGNYGCGSAALRPLKKQLPCLAATRRGVREYPRQWRCVHSVLPFGSRLNEIGKLLIGSRQSLNSRNSALANRSAHSRNTTKQSGVANARPDYLQHGLHDIDIRQGGLVNAPRSQSIVNVGDCHDPRSRECHRLPGDPDSRMCHRTVHDDDG